MKGLRRPTLPEAIQGYTAIIIGGGGVVGTGISVLLHSGLFIGLVHLWQGRFRLALHGPMAWVSAAFVFFFLAEAFAALIHYRGEVSFMEIVENVPFLAFAVLYASMARLSRQQLFDAISIGAIVGGIATGLYALTDILILGLRRAEAMAGNPGPLALVGTILFSFSLLVVTVRTGRPRAWAAVACLGAATAIVLSGMRTMLPALIIAPLCVLFLFRHRLALLSTRVLVGACVIVLAGVLLAAPFLQHRLGQLWANLDSIAGVQDFDNSLGLRLLLWRLGAGLIAEQPLLGYGPGSEAWLIREGLATQGVLRGFSHFHNFVVHYWVRSGLAGLVACGLLLIVPVVAALRGQQDELSRVGLAMVFCIVGAYTMSGTLGILFGHDITDALFVYSLACALGLVFIPDGSGASADRPAATPA